MIIEEAEWLPGCHAVLERVLAERKRQVARYGLNRDICDGTGPGTRWLGPYTPDPASAIEQALRDDYEAYEDEAGLPTWVHLLREELAETFAEDDPQRLATELVQVVALGVSWLERLQERGAKPCPGTPLQVALRDLQPGDVFHHEGNDIDVPYGAVVYSTAVRKEWCTVWDRNGFYMLGGAATRMVTVVRGGSTKPHPFVGADTLCAQCGHSRTARLH